MLGLLAFALVGRIAYERSHSWRIAGLVVALAAAMSLNNLNVRPQNWSWLLFALFLWVLHRAVRPAGQLPNRPPWLLAALPALMALWVNLHGAFILGLLLVGAFAIGETVRVALVKPGARAFGPVLWLYGAGFATAVATLVNPRGLGVFQWVRSLVTDQATQELIVEWQPPTPSGFANIVFFVSVLILIVVFAFGRRRPTPTDLILVGVFLWLAWSGQRYVQWFGLVAAPVLAGCLARPTPDGREEARGLPVMNALIAGALFVPVVLVQPWFVRFLPLPPDYVQVVDSRHSLPVPALDTPVAAADYLRSQPGGTLFNDMSYGSYLIWAVPEQRVFVDPRIEVYPRSLVLDYLALTEGTNALDLLSRYGADRALIDPRFEPKLSAALAASDRWSREYADNASEVWRYTGATAVESARQ